jgi:hypothetical protein
MINYSDGYKAAQQGGWRVAPKSLKVISVEWKAWYSGFDTAVTEGVHPNLTTKGNLRKGVNVGGKKL